MKDPDGKGKRVCFFGNFGSLNFGNECTFQAIIYHLRRDFPAAEVACICSGAEALAATGIVQAVPSSRQIFKPWKLRNPVAKLVRMVFVGIPSELYRWLEAFKILKGTDMLIIPGTGLLTDAWGVFLSWGPYNLFKWTLMAKLRRCKVLFVSVGAGPIYGFLGKCLVKSALSLADFRSYRDDSSLKCVEGIGLHRTNDRVYPDLVFSLPRGMMPPEDRHGGSRRVVGIGLMEYAGKYSIANPSNAIYLSYLENLVAFVKWLLTQEYDIRLLTGDHGDKAVRQEFISLLTSRLETYEVERVVDEPLTSADELISSLAKCNLVVATRFHNLLLALLLDRPVLSISFHHKCTSLMGQMGLSEYCHDINGINAEKLISQFVDLEQKADKLRPIIKQKVEGARSALEEQYRSIFSGIAAE